MLNLYLKQKYSKREIARQLNVSHSSVIAGLRKAGIYGNILDTRHKRKGQIPFGYDYIDGKLIKNEIEQKAILMIKQLKSNKFSLRERQRN